MEMVFALQGLLPLIVFAIVDMFASMRTAIIAAIVFSLIEAGWSWYQFGEVDKTTWISLGLIVAMGLISIRMRSDRMFKFQPVVMAAVFAVVLGWFQWNGEPLLVQMMPKVAIMLPAERQWVATDARVVQAMARLDSMMIFVFLVHGAMVAWCALHKTTMYWLIARGVGFYALMAVALVLNAVLPLS